MGVGKAKTRLSSQFISSMECFCNFKAEVRFLDRHNFFQSFYTFTFAFLKDFIYLFLERREGREKEGEKHQCVVTS